MNLVRCFIAFVRKKIAEGDQLYADWQNLTDLAEFQTYRLIEYNGNVTSIESFDFLVTNDTRRS
jgi:hypothetical protein